MQRLSTTSTNEVKHNELVAIPDVNEGYDAAFFPRVTVGVGKGKQGVTVNVAVNGVDTICSILVVEKQLKLSHARSTPSLHRRP